MIIDGEFGVQDTNVFNGGGIAERPGNMADIFHTFFGIAGLSLLGFFERAYTDMCIPTKVYDFHPDTYEMIDPTYALPCSLLAKLNVTSQVNKNDETCGSSAVQLEVHVAENTAKRLNVALGALAALRS